MGPGALPCTAGVLQSQPRSRTGHILTQSHDTEGIYVHVASIISLPAFRLYMHVLELRLASIM